MGSGQAEVPAIRFSPAFLPDLTARESEASHRVKIFVNGVQMEVQGGTTLVSLLDSLEKSDRTDMLVEVNHRFIHPKIYDSTLLEQGDEIEIIHMAMGG